MFLNWWKNRRRRKLLSQSFPERWQQALMQNVAHYPRLTLPEQLRIQEYLQVFIAEKNWEGCRGFPITEEVQATIAAQVAILVLGFTAEYFELMQSILVYPEAYLAADKTMTQGGMVLEGASAREGEAWYRGPVILAWPEVLAGASGHGGGRNLVLHEFAHQLDMLNGSIADGVPPMASSEQYQRWTGITNREYQHLCHDCEQGRPTLLDSYATKNPSEFFAVTTETFFERPLALQRHHRELYEVFREFYRQDPAARETH